MSISANFLKNQFHQNADVLSTTLQSLFIWISEQEHLFLTYTAIPCNFLFASISLEQIFSTCSMVIMGISSVIPLNHIVLL